MGLLYLNVGDVNLTAHSAITFKNKYSVSPRMVFFRLRSRIHQYYGFTRKELQDLLIAVIVTGFVFSFRDWGAGTAVDILTGIRNLIIVTALAALSYLVHESGHRLSALSVGFKAEFKLWWGGLFASLILAFVSNGIIQLILPGGLVSSLIIRQRMGEFRYGLNYWDNGFVAFFGPFANLILAMAAKVLLYFLPGNWMLQKLLLMNIVFAICTMLPIPPLDGVNTFFAGRLLYVILFFTILGTGLLLYFVPFIFSILGGILITVIATLIYYFKIENPI